MLPTAAARSSRGQTVGALLSVPQRHEVKTAEKMRLSEFINLHEPALERDQIRHNLILGVLAGARERPGDQLLLWTLGGPGQCAIETPERPIILGELQEAQCHRLAEDTAGLDYPGVLGPDRTTRWFVQRAMAVGVSFMKPIPQQIHALSGSPAYPGAPGHARQVQPTDSALFADWVTAFLREAVPHDPVPPRQDLEAKTGDGQHWFWIVDDEPVAMAGIVRRTRHAAAIAPVYTPPPQRGRGYAGSVTATVVERIFAEGRKAACLYTDLNNRSSNRCYARIGFRPVCNSWLHLKQAGRDGRSIGPAGSAAPTGMEHVRRSDRGGSHRVVGNFC